MPPQSTPPEPLLTVRATVVLLLAVLVSGVVGGLTFLVHGSVPMAVLAGLAAMGATTVSVPPLIR